MFHIAHPWYLILLAVIPFMGWYYLRKKGKKRATLRFSDIGILKEIPSSTTLKLRHIPFYLRCLGIALLIVGLSRPQSGRKETEILTEGIDIVLTLDISGSMKAEDFKPRNRLHVAKEVIKDFIRGRINDRIGLVVFAAQAYTQCPLTLDYGALLSFLDTVEIGIIEDGTAIGTALVTSVNRLRDSTAESKMIILLTDGCNNAGKIDPLTAAEIARTMDIKVYTIGAGMRGHALYPFEDPIFGKRYVKIPTEIDEEILTDIASKTGGEYYRATDPEGLEAIYRRISEMEKTTIETKDFMKYNELFVWFLFPGLATLVLEMILTNTRFRKLP
jgi:Ca-activated chloride channel family protein